MLYFFQNYVGPSGVNVFLLCDCVSCQTHSGINPTVFVSSFVGVNDSLATVCSKKLGYSCLVCQRMMSKLKTLG